MKRHDKLVARLGEHIGSFAVREFIMKLLAVDEPSVDPAEVRRFLLFVAREIERHWILMIYVCG